ncbi:winged helix-turn-helix domain-containing protein [Niameybacter massiliensis]|uniref:winged helix-turn-helix domain-containing protein n=1 Tax=Niameybacter massiliensis TaxID=1658108 RepID=UPI0006B6464D|nr:winged helix-turn-helix domain-containing protein [Niameybacter massiliensis]
MEKVKILIVDDEEHILELIAYNLSQNGFKVFTATCIQEADRILEDEVVDLTLLDIMLPDMDGMTALKKYRSNPKTQNMPIIMVTAKAEEIDKIIGLELGADDYITKPFSVREVVARVNAVVRRNQRIEKSTNKEAQELNYKDLRLDIESHTVFFGDQQLELTLKEFEILKILMQNKGRVMTREVLLDRIWGYEYYGETRTVDVHIRYLRSKLTQYGLEDCIETVRGVGYRFTKE